MVDGPALAAAVVGVFVGNWLVVPLFFKSRTFKDGFAIGVIAALLVLGFYVIV